MNSFSRLRGNASNPQVHKEVVVEAKEKRKLPASDLDLNIYKYNKTKNAGARGIPQETHEVAFHFQPGPDPEVEQKFARAKQIRLACDQQVADAILLKSMV